VGKCGTESGDGGAVIGAKPCFRRQLGEARGLEGREELGVRKHTRSSP
jgi:hypothetical protein